jgi:hypothetical protein
LREQEAGGENSNQKNDAKEYKAIAYVGSGAVAFHGVVCLLFLEREMERTHQSAQSGRLSDHNGEGE